MFNVHKKKMDLCRKENPGWALFVKKKKSVQSGDDLFSHSQEAAQSQDLSLLLISSCSSPHARHVFAPSPGPLTIPVSEGPLLLRSAGVRSSERPAEDHADNTLCSFFFMYVPVSRRTSLRASLPFFYFEVEFLHLFLELKKKEREVMSKNLHSWAKERKLPVSVCVWACSSLLTLVYLFSGWTLTLVWPSLHSLHHMLPACETCNKQKQRSLLRLFFCVSTSLLPKSLEKSACLRVYGCEGVFLCIPVCRIHLSINKRPMMVRQTDDSTTATTARAVVRLYPSGDCTGSVMNSHLSPE